MNNYNLILQPLNFSEQQKQKKKIKVHMFYFRLSWPALPQAKNVMARNRHVTVIAPSGEGVTTLRNCHIYTINN